MTERERDNIWKRIDELRLMVNVLDKSVAVQSMELERIGGRVEDVHTQFISKLDRVCDKMDVLTEKIRNDSDELRKREGIDIANKRWSWFVISVLGLLFAAGGFIHFQPAITSMKLYEEPYRYTVAEKVID